jgi:hypothetical protein
MLFGLHLHLNPSTPVDTNKSPELVSCFKATHWLIQAYMISGMQIALGKSIFNLEV